MPNQSADFLYPCNRLVSISINNILMDVTRQIYALTDICQFYTSSKHTHKSIFLWLNFYGETHFQSSFVQVSVRLINKKYRFAYLAILNQLSKTFIQRQFYSDQFDYSQEILEYKLTFFLTILLFPTGASIQQTDTGKHK